MSLGQSIKQAIITGALNKRAKAKIKNGELFDVKKYENIKLPANAPDSWNNSNYFFWTNFKSKETFYFRQGLRGGKDSNEVWFVYSDGKGNTYTAADEFFKKDQKISTSAICNDPERKLTFTFSGAMYKVSKKGDVCKAERSKKPVNVDMKATFTGIGKIFEFTYDLAPKTLARALSKEKDLRKTQKEFSDNQQIHYEQSGTVSGKIKIDNKETTFTDYPSFRDRSFGKREWDFMNRYVWNVILLENGEFIHTSLIRYPMLHELQAGFLFIDNKYTSLYKCISMDKLPITGSTPKFFENKVQYIDGRKRTIKSNLEFVITFPFANNSFIVNEGVCEYDVNGVRGRGISEFGFNGDKSKWDY